MKKLRTLAELTSPIAATCGKCGGQWYQQCYDDYQAERADPDPQGTVERDYEDYQNGEPLASVDHVRLLGGL